MSSFDMEMKLKLLSAGREDVDVRCLGNGRPFAIEVDDPVLLPSEQQLEDVCREINKSADVIVNNLKVIPKFVLTNLKEQLTLIGIIDMSGDQSI